MLVKHSVLLERISFSDLDYDTESSTPGSKTALVELSDSEQEETPAMTRMATGLTIPPLELQDSATSLVCMDFGPESITEARKRELSVIHESHS